MSDPAAKPSIGVLKWALWGAAVVGVAAVVYIMAQSSTKPADTLAPMNPGAETARSAVLQMGHPADGRPAPAFSFRNADDQPVTLADFRGRVVVVNLWATWCAPCRQEMPQLAKLQAHYQGKPVAVVAISIDEPQQLAQAKAFIARQPPLGFYNDPTAKLPWALKPAAAGVPTTVIYGPDGLERGRVAGQADWASAGVRRFIDGLIER